MPPEQTTNNKWIRPIIAFLIFGILVYLGLRTSKEPTMPAETEAPAPVETVKWPSQEVRQETIADTSVGYAITAKYPVTQSDVITDVMKTFVTNAITSFKSDTALPVEEAAQYGPYTMDVSYRNIKNDAADNYLFSSYSDTGGAHGLSSTTTFSFDSDGRQLSLNSLFTDTTKGLATAAVYVQKELLTREFADKAWIEEGAAPLEDNYQRFIVDPSGVTFFFDQYQVAAYAAGLQEVKVPLSVFRSYANLSLFAAPTR